MNIDPDKIKELVKIFAELNEKRQMVLMNKAIYLLFEQGQENNINENQQPISTEELNKRTSDSIKEAVKLINIMEDLDKNQMAALGLLVNELSNGEFAKEEEIQITINSHKISIEDYINNNLPGADINKAKEILEKAKKDIEIE